MYISMNWINDFVDLKGINLEELINRFTLSVAEVEGTIKYGENIKNVITAKIVEIEKIESSDKLRKVKVDNGKEIVTCVCGAKNIKIGDIVPFAQIGSMVNGIEIKQVQMAGETSNGMCLSEKELGISEDHSGVMVFDSNTKLGVNVKQLLDIDDTVFEIDNKSLTNRPDLWGHYGIAREIAALTGRKLKNIEVENLEEYNNLKEVRAEVEDKEKCYRYTAIEVENITSKKFDINKRIRLYYCGMRSINLLVDLTNYIMLELGQPMHAFDKKLVNKIKVKSIENDIEFKTLDDVTRKVDKGTLMICNNDEPIAIAGIMGGANSEITDSTNSLVLESANFDSVCIRKSAVELKLRTDASAHYEKSLDPEITDIAIKRYIKLLKENDKDIKISSKLTDIYVNKYPTIKIKITRQYINSRIGTDLSLNKIKEILSSLEFEIEENGEILTVKVPSFRATKDISIKADLVEEIARIYGYDNIEPQTKNQPLRIVEIDDEKKTENTIKDLLAIKYGLSEIHTYIWYDRKKNKELNLEVNENNIKLANSLNANFNVLRESMIPSLLYTLSENIKYYPNVNIFECGRTFEYPNKGEECIENKNLGIALCSKNKSSKELIYKRN
jgi:phenylalanyl-tRNA synthetase beta chain